MKKETSDGSKNPKPKILGATPLQIGEDDAAGLVGGIVEKGFTDNKQARRLGPTAAPRPSVLPFPVARHRSHGPHWGPKVVNDNDDVDEDVGEEEDCDGMELAAGVANPVGRKEKKRLDFSRWKEIVKNDSNSVLYEKKKEMHLSALEVGHKTQERKSDNLNRDTGSDHAKLRGTSRVDNAKEHFMTKHDKASSVFKEVKEETEAMSEMASAKELHSFEHVKNENIIQPSQWPQSDIDKSEDITLVQKVPMQNESSKETRVDSKMQRTHKMHVASGFAVQNVVGREGSLENQIDAENHARLAKMSADEIAEAQAEIMAKLNPELINALKKRGQAKLKRQKFSSSEIIGGEADDKQHEKNPSDLTANSYNSTSDKPVEKVPQDTPKDKGDKSFSNTSPQNRGLWDAWSKRVERVRDMRFSLDGNIIGSDFAHVSDKGEGSSASGYNADNVAERDFLRTEGDPGAVGYTIKEAVALARSVVPGQRTFALNLIAAILDRAICSICRNQAGSASNCTDAEGSVDWEAIWAFTLGPEPDLALSLRMSLDDNHNSVVLACAKAIQSVLSCDMNEIIFDISEKSPTYARDVHTAPVFRSKPDVNSGFLRGGFWKYNTKPSNILCFPEESVGDTAEGEHTIQDDIVVAGQDFAAGLVRMGILPRICYLLETDPAAPLEECLISILIAISRHSPTCAAAVMDCGRLVQTVASRFASKEQMEINSCKIKSVVLLKVLARVEKKNCLTFIKNGIFRQVTWHLYRHPFSLDQWVKSGREACRLSSALLVEQLRLWKVFIHYGYCISDFSDLFASLCIWLGVPTIDKLVNYDVMNEYCAITREVYLLLDVLAGRLPNFYSSMHERLEDAAQDKETWLWSHFGAITNLAIEWIEMKGIPYVSRLFECQNKDGKYRSLQDSEINSMLWVISSVLNMLSSVLKAVIKEDTTSAPKGHLPWLPDFVPKIGLEIIKNGYLRVSGVSDTICNNNLLGNGSIVEYLCHLRIEKGQELAISSTCCLQGLFQVVALVDELIQHADLEIHNAPSKFQSLTRKDKILANGILKSCAAEVQYLLTTLMKLITNEWQCMQPVEMFGRGGPAPGVGVSWGASGGGYWSSNALLAQEDARLLIYLLEISEIPFAEDPLEAGGMGQAMQRLNCCLAACLILGPGNSHVIDQLLKVIFHVPVLKYLDFGIHQFLCHKGYKPFGWNYEDEEYLLFANVLASHFRNRWLTVKNKRKAIGEINRVSHKPKKQNDRALETIHEDMDAPNTAGEESVSVPIPSESSSLTLEWAYQRLPLPAHWFLSSISTIYCETNVCPPGASKKETYIEVPSNFLEVAKGGLFFLLGIEAIPTLLGSDFYSPIKCVPVVWKLHAMSVILLSGMGILENEKSRDVYETLQNVYGETLDGREVVNLHGNLSVEALQFESEIHENYSTFIETLVEQFAAESYGDILFGRQVAIYLHRSVEASVRLSTWNALSNARALELLPPLAKCCTQAKGYLEPIEDDERILEAYVKSWVSGALDKAAKRNSMAFSLVLHHLSSFIFSNVAGDMLTLRSKLAKSLLRDYSRKQQHEGMLVKLICYEKPNMSSPAQTQVEKRLQVLKEICDGHMSVVQKLESCITTYLDSRN